MHLSDVITATASSEQAELPPAISLPLVGQHLIEASAGTGKTWTLTGVVLRLIVEGGYPCDKIIATTFTRSAAAEMRQRIRERLQDLYVLLRFITEHSYSKAIQLSATPELKLQQCMHWLAAIPKTPHVIKALEDPINAYLVEWIAKQVFGVTDVTKAATQTIQTEADKSPSDTVDQAITATIDAQQTTMAMPPQLDLMLDAASSTTSNRTTSDNSKPRRAMVDFRIALQRTSNALNQLDRLFVSTLDSLCQKWLREFSSETGYSADVQISEDVGNIITGMIHDQLRAFWMQINVHEPEIYALMQAYGKLLSTDDYYNAVQTSLNFYTAPIDLVTLSAFDIAPVLALIHDIIQIEEASFDAYFDADYRKSRGMTVAFGKLMNEWPMIKAQLAQQGLFGLLVLTESQVKLLDYIDEAVNSNKTLFKKDFSENETNFIALPLVQAIAKLSEYKKQIEQHMDELNVLFTRFISVYVRQHLPQVLEAQRLTTFGLQLARLNQALSGKQGKALARYIRHQYPVALIDESQDINTEQALLIQRIYLQDSTSANQYFLLLVGDPKQAIYGFRGGDVHNYTTLKQFFKKNTLSLTHNRRSSKALIDSLNVWYGVADPVSKTCIIDTNQLDNPTNIDHDELSLAPYYLGEQIYYRYISATRDAAELMNADLSVSDGQTSIESLPTVYQLMIEYQQAMPQAQTSDQEEIDYIDFADAVCAQILALFDPVSDKLHYQGRPLALDDICVLAYKNRALDDIEHKLQARGIATIRGGNQSVFSDSMSQDLLTLMTVLLSPYNKAKIKALLISNFFKLTLAEANALSETDDSIDDGVMPSSQNKVVDKQAGTQNLPIKNSQIFATIQAALLKASEQWQQEGFLVAIQGFLNQVIALPHQPAQSFWQRLASHSEGERLLIDLRQLLDILSEQFVGKMVGEYQIYDWYYQQIQTQPREEWALQQRLPSETGVQLMTIHRSKGLEFPIVFIVGLTSDISSKFGKSELFLYTAPQANMGQASLLNRRLSPVSVSADGQIDYAQFSKQRNYEEALRLLYVALTRAQERLYIVTQQGYSKKQHTPLNPFVDDNKLFILKPSIQEVVSLVDMDSLTKYLDKTVKLNQFQQNSQTIKQSLPIDYDDNIKLITSTSFQGWANTSFTGLAQHTTGKMPIAEDVDIEDTASIQDSDSQINDEVPSPDDFELGNFNNGLVQDNVAIDNQLLRFRFERGTGPGTFLHQVLEDLANNPYDRNIMPVNDSELWQPPAHWGLIIDRALRSQQLPEHYFTTLEAAHNELKKHDRDEAVQNYPFQPAYLELSQWLHEVIHTPLYASGQRLVDIRPHYKVAEMSFNMRLQRQLSLAALNALFAKYDINLQLQTNYHPSALWRYLRGEIDLVYQHQQQYYIVDYKSNYLGDQFEHYHQSALNQSMIEHNYYLQASIYQVALHRYLQLRLPSYDIKTHLGAVEYAFIRGMSPYYSDYGRLTWQPEPEFILELDALFGSDY